MKKAIAYEDINALSKSLREFQTFSDYNSIFSQYQDKKFNLDEVLDIAVGFSSRSNSGPFGAVLAIKEDTHYNVLSVGSNLVVSNNNSMLHAEIVALINFLKQNPTHNKLPDKAILITSCEPCSQCRSFFLAMGGKSENIISVLSKSDAAKFGGFADDSLYKVATDPISARNIGINSDLSLLDTQLAFVTSKKSTVFELGDSFISSVIKSYYDYSRAEDVSFESLGTTLIINKLPEEFARPLHKPLLRLFFSVLDWAKLTLQVQDSKDLDMFSDIVLYTKEEISSGQFETDKKEAAALIMKQWKQQYEHNSYGQDESKVGLS